MLSQIFNSALWVRMKTAYHSSGRSKERGYRMLFMENKKNRRSNNGPIQYQPWDLTILVPFSSAPNGWPMNGDRGSARIALDEVGPCVVLCHDGGLVNSSRRGVEWKKIASTDTHSMTSFLTHPLGSISLCRSICVSMYGYHLGTWPCILFETLDMFFVYDRDHSLSRVSSCFLTSSIVSRTLGLMSKIT